MLADVMDIGLAVTGRMMIEQLQCLCDLCPIVGFHRCLSFFFQQFQDLLYGVRGILACIVQIADHLLLPGTP